MRLVRDIYAAKGALRQPVISFEFFPPKTEEGDRNLLEKTIPALLATKPDYCSVTYGAGGSTREKTLKIVERIQRQHGLTAVAHLTCVCATQDQIQALKPLAPDFVSVTYGAGGSTRDGTVEIATRIKHEHGLEAMAHLSCVGETREGLVEILDRFEGAGIENVLALRGDPPGGGEFQPTPGGFEYSDQLVRFIREQGDFCIGVAGFPEGHVACKGGKLVDWGHLKKKIDAGADFVLTQLFFDNTDFQEFRDHLTQKHGVKVPLVPGIIPILSASQIKRFTAMCGARIPAALAAKLDELGDNDEAVSEFGVEYATTQCKELLRNGAPGIHFYTLNKARATVGILQNLGLA